MQAAYREAVRAAERGEVPVGAVLVDKNGVVLAQAGNSTIGMADPSAHAEILALRRAGQVLNNYRLPDTIMYVTLEPCLMCMGAMIHARVSHLVFAASDPKTGAARSCWQIGDDARMHHHLSVESGPLAAECGQLLRDFFKQRRK
ncbi:MAG: nucleoside deaminase [Deltaproteobacteria bacterium]|nr:nucleoside deaminase [Deltaproteobacteria bacterium]